MLFALSKLLWAVLSPGNLLLFCALAGTLGLLSRRARVRNLGRGLLVLGLGAMAAIAVLPLGAWLLAPLEERFARPAEPLGRVDGVVVLGGAVDLRVSVARGRPQLGAFADRLTAFVALARRYPRARLVFTGGSGALFDTGHSEADVAENLIAELGLDPVRVAFERQARNTRENALLAMALAQPQAGETWLLVTSAFHMPRAMGSFGRAGWPVTAYPVDYLRAGPGRWRPGFSLMHGLSLLTLAEKEWIGLAAYRLLGWTDRLFPDPGDV